MEQVIKIISTDPNIVPSLHKTKFPLTQKWFVMVFSSFCVWMERKEMLNIIKQNTSCFVLYLFELQSADEWFCFFQDLQKARLLLKSKTTIFPSQV